MTDKGEAGFDDPLGDDFDGFNIIQFMNDNDDLIESLAERSSSSKSSSSAANLKAQRHYADQNSSRNTESVEGEIWISPVPSDDYQLPQTINMNTPNFTNNINNNNNNVFIIDSSTSNVVHSQQSRTIIPQKPNYPSSIAYSNTGQIEFSQFTNPSPAQYISPQQNFGTNMMNQKQNLTMEPPPAKRKALNLLIETPTIKQEPIYDYGNNMISPSISRMESNENLQQRQIQFIPFNVEQWTTLYNINQQPFTNFRLDVVADKGVN
jgi:hypothetical protein